MRKLLILVFMFVGFSTLILLPKYATAQSSDSISVQTIEGPSVSEIVINKAHESWPWYVARGSGLVAAISLVLLMLSGIGQITGQTYKILEPLTAWASHRSLGIVFMISVIVHMFVFLFDKFIAFSIWDILLPWFSDFKPLTLFGVNLGSAYLALGILSFYLSIAIVATSLLIINKKPKIWKLVHFLSYVVILLVFIHALQIGTDLASGILRLIWIILGNILSLAIIYRTWRSFTT